jgi:ribosomal protein S30
VVGRGLEKMPAGGQGQDLDLAGAVAGERLHAPGIGDKEAQRAPSRVAHAREYEKRVVQAPDRHRHSGPVEQGLDFAGAVEAGEIEAERQHRPGLFEAVEQIGPLQAAHDQIFVPKGLTYVRGQGAARACAEQDRARTGCRVGAGQGRSRAARKGAQKPGKSRRPAPENRMFSSARGSKVSMRCQSVGMAACQSSSICSHKAGHST